MTDSKRSGNSSLRSKLRGIKPAVIEKCKVKDQNPGDEISGAKTNIQQRETVLSARFPFCHFDFCNFHFEMRRRRVAVCVSLESSHGHLPGIANRGAMKYRLRFGLTPRGRPV